MKKTILSLFIGSALSLTAGNNSQNEVQSCTTMPFAVVELFTSQGCSSCPSAEKIVSDLYLADKAAKRNVIYIAEHVKYWDYLGWTDPYGEAQFATRQNVYKSALGFQSSITPQVIANGTTVCPSKTSIINAVNAKLGTTPTVGVCVSLQSAASASTLQINYTINGNYSMNSSLYVALVEDNLSTYVTAGENANMTLAENITSRVFTSFSINSGGTGTVSITPPQNVNRNNARIVAWVQDGSSMAITGATTGIDLGSILLGVNNALVKASFDVYPNPANETLYIHSANAEKKTIRLMDLAGRVAFETQLLGVENSIDVSSLAKGVYNLQVANGTEILNKKIVVE